MIAALLCATLIAQNQDAPRVTVEQRALRADVALRKIGEKFGVRLSPDRSTKNDVLLVYLPDVTFAEFRNKTAKGWNANWKRNEDGWTLLRTADHEQAEMQAYIASRAKELKRRMSLWSDLSELTDIEAEGVANALANSEDRRTRFESLRSLERGWFRTDTLGRRALRRFLLELGPESLASLHVGRMRVFESGEGLHRHPALDDLLRTYERENGRIRDALSSIGRLEEMEQLVDEYGPVDLLLKSLDVTNGASKLVVKIWGDTYGLSPTLYAFDEDGLALFYVDDLLFTRSRSSSPFPLDEPLNLTISDKAAKILEYFELRADDFSYGNEAKDAIPLIGSAAFDVLRAMPEDDEYSYEPSETLVTLSRTLGLGLVARLSDELQGGLSISRVSDRGDDPDRTKRTLTKLPGMFAITHRVAVDHGDRLLIVEPVTPTTLRTVFPREAIAEFCRRAASTSGADVYDLGAMYRAAPDFETLMGLEYLADLVPEYQWASQTYALYWHQYVVLGWLNAAQHQMARTPLGVTVRLDQVPDIVRKVLDAVLVYTSFTHQLLDSDTFEALGHPGERSIDYLAALALPDGVPPKSTVNIKIVDERYIFTEDQDEPKTSVDLEDTARHYNSIDGDEGSPRDKWLATVPFRVGTAVKVTIQVNMGPALYSESGLIVTSLGDGRAYRFNELPADVQKEFWKFVEAWSRPFGGEARAA